MTERLHRPGALVVVRATIMLLLLLLLSRPFVRLALCDAFEQLLRQQQVGRYGGGEGMGARPNRVTTPHCPVDRLQVRNQL